MKLKHPELTKSLRTAYSGEKAAAFAYVGHAASLSEQAEIEAVNRIERDEWEHGSM